MLAAIDECGEEEPETVFVTQDDVKVLDRFATAIRAQGVKRPTRIDVLHAILLGVARIDEAEITSLDDLTKRIAR